MFRLFVSRTTARRPRNATPQLEALEQVLSLSATGWGAQDIIGTSSPSEITHPIVVASPPSNNVVTNEVLVGRLSGSYATHPVADLGTSYNLTGNGLILPFGSMNVTGDLHGAGSVSPSRAGGTLTLFDSDGTLTLALEGPQQNSFAPLPKYFNYTITGGTGAFANAAGQGKAFLEFVPATTTNLLAEQGHFDLFLVGTA